MSEESPRYVIDLTHPLNQWRIPKAIPNDEITVLVFPESDPTAVRVSGRGKLEADGQTFKVTAPVAGGEEVHYWAYGILCGGLAFQAGI